MKADAVVGRDSRGFDGGKLVNGRKRHVVVDTLGLLLGVVVTAADPGDRTAAHVMLWQAADAHHRLELVWADGGCTSSLIAYCLTRLALVLAIVKRSDGPLMEPAVAPRDPVRLVQKRLGAVDADPAQETRGCPDRSGSLRSLVGPRLDQPLAQC